MVGFVSRVDPRLERRYWKLVSEHSTALKSSAAGLRALPASGKAFASTQAMWRFLRNDRMPRSRLVEPLWSYARERLAADGAEIVLVVHDWSPLEFRDHESNRDRIGLPSDWNRGYELLTALLVSAQDGQPIAPVTQALEAVDGVHATYSERLQPARSHLDALRPMMRAAEKAAEGIRCVHVIDREGNAVFYLRKWNKQKRWFLIRSDYNRVVRHEGEERNLRSLAQLLARRARSARQARCGITGVRRLRKLPRLWSSWIVPPTNSVPSTGGSPMSSFEAHLCNSVSSSVACSTRSTSCLPSGTC